MCSFSFDDALVLMRFFDEIFPISNVSILKIICCLTRAQGMTSSMDDHRLKENPTKKLQNVVERKDLAIQSSQTYSEEVKPCSLKVKDINICMKASEAKVITNMLSAAYSITSHLQLSNFYTSSQRLTISNTSKYFQFITFTLVLPFEQLVPFRSLHPHEA